MQNLWIIHREPRFQSALARLAEARRDAILGAPGDPKLDSAPAADAIVLGLAGDFEAELQFAHRIAPRFPATRWVLVASDAEVDRARLLFDTLDCAVLPYPPEPRALRAALASTGDAQPLPLSRRPARDDLADRFSRWFGDLDLPELLRVLDPHLADVPLLIRGEPGTGRGLLARYVHAFGGGSRGTFVHVPCDASHGPDDILALAASASGDRGTASPTVWLDGADALSAETQRVLAGWVEYAPPAHRLGPLPRWIASIADDESRLTAALHSATARFELRIPPLRDRRGAIASFAAETARRWCHRRHQRARRFAEDAAAELEAYPWPGNLRELEDVVLGTLLGGSADPIHAADLRHEPFPTDLREAAPDDADPEPIVEAESADEPAAAISELDADTSDLRRLVGAVAHEVRNPLTTIRTFAELLPEQYQDVEFREQFSELVGRDVDRIDAVVSELAQLAALPAPGTRPVESTQLLEELLERRREWIQARKLLVLKELDREAPLVLGDAEQLRIAFEALLDKCIEITPRRGDLYFASKHHAAGLRGRPSVRVLVRFHGPRDEAPSASANLGVSAAENALEFAIAGVIVRAHQGVFAVQTGEGGETVVVLELPAPG